MIHLTLTLPGEAPRQLVFDRPTITLGRAAGNDIVVAADNVSSRHGMFCFSEGCWLYRDLKSTNGSLVLRGTRRFLLDREPREILLEPGDRICIASGENVITIDKVDGPAEDQDDRFEQTILAEQEAHAGAALENALSEDSDALRALVTLAREVATLNTTNAIAELACRLALKVFPQARRAIFLRPHADYYAPEYVLTREGADEQSISALAVSRRLIDRCLKERKAYLFLFEQDRVRAVATRILQAETIMPEGMLPNRCVLCCPLFNQDRCHGFLEIEASIEQTRSSLTRRDLALATLMGHLLAARLADLAQQVERLKLARKATAGFMAATVGHCFKNLLFVPMSMSRMLPMCVKQGKMEEAEWMLARNSVNIRYLDILSNEFAAASKDPSEGFMSFDAGVVLREAAELVNQIAPEKVEAFVECEEGLGEIVCHPTALKRLVMNLVLNAVDAIFGQKREEKGRIDLQLRRAAGDDSHVELLVRDNGPGIPSDILQNLKEIFRQVQASTDALAALQDIAERVRSTKDQGLKEHYGLGFLFVCQTVRQHSGDLAIEAAEGVGSSFTIRLPVRGPQHLNESPNTTER